MRISRPRLTPREFGILAGGALLCTLILGALVVANTRWSALLPGGGGLYTIWAAARALLFQQADPYGPLAAARVQQLVYDGAAVAPQNPYRLDLPFFLMPLYLPLGLIAEPAVARGVWATVAQLAVVGAIFVTLQLVDWRPPRASLWLLCTITILSYPVVAALVDGTLVSLLLLVYVSILWALRNGHDELAGALAVVALCKWEAGLPFVLALAFRMLEERRWRIAAGFGMALTILFVVSLLIFPGWLMHFLVAAVAMLRSEHGVSSYSALQALFPEADARVGLAITVLVSCILLVELLGARRDERRFTWMVFLALAATPLLGLRSELPNLITVIPGTVMIVAGGSQRPPYGGWFSWILLGVLAIAPWILNDAGRSSRLADASTIIFLLLPLGYVVGMYWTRWWILRPARTWLDQIRQSR